MATSSEQPPKKRRLLYAVPSPSPSPPDDVPSKRKNTEEIRSLYECYKQIKLCVSKNDARLVPNFEQAYHSFISASRGCTSVQRIVAELIPRYASFCPTALEAATKVIINMHNWTLNVIMKGEDVDGVAYETVKACIFGLVDICLTAACEAPTSSVIRGICPAVFVNVLSFFTSVMEGKDIFQFADSEIITLFGDKESFYELKQEQARDTESVLSRLFKFQALSLLRIFVCCPKSLLAACFELLSSSGTDNGIQKKAEYLLHQVTAQLNVNEIRNALERCSETNAFAGILFAQEQIFAESKGHDEDKDVQADESMNQEKCPVLSNCLMEMVIHRDPSLKRWILLKYNNFCKLRSKVVLESSLPLENIVGSLEEVSKPDFEENNDGFDSVKIINQPYLCHTSPCRHDNSADLPDMDCSSGALVKSSNVSPLDDCEVNDKGSVQVVRPCSLSSTCKVENQTLNDALESELERSSSRKNLEISAPNKPSLSKGKVEKDITKKNHAILSEEHVLKSEAAQESIERITSGTSPTSKQNIATDHVVWYYDRDPEAMDVFLASKLLWLSSIGYDASETSVRRHFEDFGPIEKLLILPSHHFVLIEYCNIMDAVRAREYMHGISYFGARLTIKFLDVGLGSKGVINSTPVGNSRYVYVGKVTNRRVKDEILYEIVRGGPRPPHMVTELSSENALLLEFVTSEEATVAMTCIQRKRKESEYSGSSSNNFTKDNFSCCRLLVRHIDISVSDEELISVFSGFGDLTGWKFMRQIGCCLMYFRLIEDAQRAKFHLDGARFGRASIRVEIMTDGPGDICSSSPRQRSIPGSSTRGTKTLNQLSSLCASLSGKYNINQTFSHNASHKRKCHSSSEGEHIQLATNTLSVIFPDTSSPFLTDEELKLIFNVAGEDTGSVVRVTYAEGNAHHCFVEFSSTDAAFTASKNIKGCPGMFLQVEFSEGRQGSGNPSVSSNISSHDDYRSTSAESNRDGNHLMLEVKSGNVTKLVSPQAEVQSCGREVQDVHAFHPKWSTNTPPAKEGYALTDANRRSWQYSNAEITPQPLPPGNLAQPLTSRNSESIIPPPVQTTSFVSPAFVAHTNSWDGLNSSLPHNQIVAPIPPNNNPHSHQCPPIPFIPSSVTPLAQLQGSSGKHFEQIGAIPLSSPPPPPPPDVPPPVPPPPPLPLSHPPHVPPPPPCSPPHPPESHVKTSNIRSGGLHQGQQWQGTLSKSGVHYCTILAHRVESDSCKYSNGMSEPSDWPARLDVTKRTDFRHVKATFSTTLPQKREVCRLLPSTPDDQKGFHDFVSYLKQRQCSGVIKIPAGNCGWPRLLFILPHSADICSMLSIASHPSESLIALVLAKETHAERA